MYGVILRIGRIGYRMGPINTSVQRLLDTGFKKEYMEGKYER